MKPVHSQIVILVSLETKTLQSLKAFPHFLRNAACEAKPFLVQRRHNVAYEFSQIVEFIISATRPVHRKREQAIAIIKNRRGTDNFIRIIVN